MSFLQEYLELSLNGVFLQTILSKYPDTEYAVMLIPAAVILIMTWLFLIHLLKARAVYTPDYVMKMDKPFYISKSGWNSILEKARFHKLAHDEFPAYISYKKPYYFSDRKIDY
ncbi:MAG: hypothetical protein ABFR82_01610 [Nitrospirota bacterium]